MATVSMQVGQAASIGSSMTQQILQHTLPGQQLSTCSCVLGREPQQSFQSGHTRSIRKPLQSLPLAFRFDTKTALISSEQARTSNSGRQAVARCAFPKDANRSSPFAADSLRPSLLKHSLQHSLHNRPSSSPYGRENPRTSVVVRVYGGGGPEQEQGRQLGKYLGYATWGLVIWAALTGQLHWFFEGLTALSLAIFAVPVIFLLIFLGLFAWTSTKQVKGPCTSCGADLSVVTLKDSLVIVGPGTPGMQVPINDEKAFDCPSCGASLKVENKEIVRGRPTFDSGVDTNVFSQMFGRQQAQKTGSSAASQPIVDIEAEVRDKD